MTPTLELEDRLRQGLQAAAEALPPAPEAVPTPGEQVVRARRSTLAGPSRLALLRRRPALLGLATAAAIAALAGTAVVLDDGDPASPPDVDAASEQTTTTTAPPHEPRPVNGMVPGRAVGGDGELRLFGPDGRPDGVVDVSPLGYVHSGTSDLEGGWVVCGSVYKTLEELNPNMTPEELEEMKEATIELPDELAEAEVTPDGSPPELTERGHVTGGWADVMMWFPAGGAPVELDGNVGFPGCMDSTVQVVDSAEGPVALIGGVSFGESGGDMHPRLDGIVLATGERREYPVPPLDGLPMQWSVSTDRALTYIDGAGLQLFDLADAEQVPTAAIDPGDASDLALSHDGRTAAVLKGAVSGPVEAIVYDLATGDEIYRRSFDMSSEGDQMSYDGTTLAVGNFYDGYGPVTVIDVASGAEHTVDAFGLLL